MFENVRRYCVLWIGLRWYGVVWCGMVKYGMGWYEMVCDDIIWYIAKIGCGEKISLSEILSLRYLKFTISNSSGCIQFMNSNI